MTIDIAVKAMALAEEIHTKNAIKIGGGKKYSKVVHRIEAFRRTVGYDYGIETQISVLNGGYTVKAEIKDASGRLIASGCSYADKLAKEKALEKLETTAIGRALANLGLGGDEYASLDEVDSFEERYTPKTTCPFTTSEARVEWMKHAKTNIEALKSSDEVSDWISTFWDSHVLHLGEKQQEAINSLLNEQRLKTSPVAA